MIYLSVFTSDASAVTGNLCVVTPVIQVGLFLKSGVVSIKPVVWILMCGTGILLCDIVISGQETWIIYKSKTVY